MPSSNSFLPSFKIDFRDFLKGNNSHENYPDGGFKAHVQGLNLQDEKTFITNGPGPSYINITDEVTNIVAWGGSVIDGTLLAVGSDGTFYKVNTFDGSLTVIANDAVNYYAEGTTTIAYYQGYYYVTSGEDIARLPGDLSSVNTTYWTVTLGQSPLIGQNYHALVVFRDILYISDFNVLHQIDSVTVQLNVLDLPLEYTITSMIIFGNSFYIGTDASGGISKVFTWDGGINPNSGGTYTWNTDYDIDGRITCFQIFQGVLYAIVLDFSDIEGNNLVYFDGIKFKTIRNVAQNTEKYSMTVCSGAMYLLDDLLQTRNCLTRYGKVVNSAASRNIFYKNIVPPFDTGLTNQLRFNSLYSFGGFLFVSARTQDDNKARIMVYQNLDEPSQADNTEVSVDFNTREFSSQVKPRKIIAQFQNIDTDIDQIIEFAWISDQNEIFDIPIPTTVNINNKYRVSIDINSATATKEITLRVTIKKAALFKSIECFYEPVETPVNT